MTQVTLSCRFAAIHLETPLLGFFRNYLPSRIRALFVFFDNLKKAPFRELFLFLFSVFCFLFFCFPCSCRGSDAVLRSPAGYFRVNLLLVVLVVLVALRSPAGYFRVNLLTSSSSSAECVQTHAT